MKISTKKLEAVLKFAAKEDARYYLEGVHVLVKAGKCHLIASDGTAMFCGVFDLPEDNEMFDCDIIISSDNVKTALKLAKKAKETEIALTFPSPEENMMAWWTLGATAFRPIDGKFPDVQRLINLARQKANNPKEASNYNFDYLVDARDALRLWDNTPKANNYALHQRGMDAASMHALIGNAFVLIMPLRVDNDDAIPVFHDVAS